MYLVIDIGGTYTKYGYYHQNGECLQHNKYKTIKTNLDDFYNKIVSLSQNVNAIAISMPGLIDNQTGMIHNITLLPFLNKHNIKEELEQRTKLKVSVENDDKCATLGEMWKGNLKNIQNGLFIILGSGIGGTIIFNGKILTSPHHKVGEIGSILMPLDTNYQQMTNFGANNNANQLIHQISQQTHCLKDGYTTFEMIKKDKNAKEIFKTYCRQIAFMIYNLDYILDLDVVCLGGGISEQNILIETIQEEFISLRTQYKEDCHEPIITACKHHNEANLLGALYHHLQTIK